MMGPPKPVGLEQPIGVADKIAIGEEKQFDQFVHGLFAAAAGARLRSALDASEGIDELIRSAVLT